MLNSLILSDNTRHTFSHQFEPTMNAIELFCGLGGTSLGFRQAGFNIKAGLDFSPHAMKTFSQNFPEAASVCKPIQDVTGKELLDAAGLSKVDVLIGGPSCQGYSTMGKRFEDDPRNFLFSHYIRLVRELQPTWLLFENVRGMQLYSKGRFIKALTEELSELGYSCCFGVHNCADFGVPQRRERFFLIGTRHGFTPSFPEATHQDPRCPTCARPDGSKRVRLVPRCHENAELFPAMPCFRCSGSRFEPPHMLKLKPWTSVWEAIGDLAFVGDAGGDAGFQNYDQSAFSAYQKLMRAKSRGYDLHLAKPVSALAYEVISQVQEGHGLRSIPEEDLPARFKTMRKISNGKLRRDCTTLYYRLSRHLPSYTITCSFSNVASGAFVHPLSNRAITPREAARLQSFPDSFQLHNSQLKSQIGNAVPPLMAEVLARHVKYMEDYHAKREKRSRRSVERPRVAI